jgi:hypothetical protein
LHHASSQRILRTLLKLRRQSSRILLSKDNDDDGITQSFI